LAGYIISEIDIYIEGPKASSIEDMEAIVIIFHRVISALIRLKRMPIN